MLVLFLEVMLTKCALINRCAHLVRKSSSVTPVLEQEEEQEHDYAQEVRTTSSLHVFPTPAVLPQGAGAVKTTPQPTYPHNRMIRSMFLRSTSLTAVIAAAAFAFSSTSPVIAQQKDVTIGLAVANLQADFFNQIKQSVEAEAKAKGVTVITVDAKGDSATQVSEVQDPITRGIKALIYIPA